MNWLQSWQYRRFHISYLVAWLAFGVLLGLVFAKLNWFQISAVGIVVAGFLLIGAFKSRRWYAIGFAVICGVLIGVERGTVIENDLKKYENFAGAQILVSGVIDDDPVYGKRGDQQFRLREVSINSLPMRGEIFVGTYNILDIKRGDKVELKGKLSKGFGSYQATMRYATLVSATQPINPVMEFRDRFASGVRNIVAEPAASLGLGFVVGQRSALPEELDDQLRMVGLTHIVVASGYNLTILVRFMRRLFARHSKYFAFASSMTLMVGFVAVSGLSPSMTRAAAVTGLSLLAWYYGRRFHPLQLIVFVAALTAWWYPVYIWSDIGWYLSFLAFGGVLIAAPLIVHTLYRDKDAPAVAQLLIETIAATVMTLPLILFIFGQLPVFTLLSNVLVAPVIPLAMVATTLAGFTGMLAPSLFGVVGEFAGLTIGYVVAVVEMLASIPWTQLTIQIPLLAMSALYVVISGAIIVMWSKTKYNFRATSVVD